MRPPEWLPYRLRSAWDDWRIASSVRGLARTLPRAARPASEASAEVHILVCRRDLRIAALTLKSLLRFEDLNLAVCVTEDGSLTRADRRWLDRQVPQCRWLPRRVDEPSFVTSLRNFPRLEQLYRSDYHPICKLLHPTLLSKCQRVVILDPDTAFHQRPELLARWLAGQETSAYYLYDAVDEDVRVPEVVRETFSTIAARIKPSGRTWHLKHMLFNSGLLCYDVDRLDLGIAERYLEWRESAPEDLRKGQAAIWFGNWTPEQTCYLVTFALMQPPAIGFPPEYHLGGGEGYVFNHYLRAGLVQPETLDSLTKLIRAV
jgi:hypothetical protein